MGSFINLLAFVIFATSLFMRSVDPVIPQIAAGLAVATATAAMLSTAFTLPYALVQPVLGALADMFSKTRLISSLHVHRRPRHTRLRPGDEFRDAVVLRIVAGMTAGGIFPIAFAVAGDRVPVAQRQVAFGKAAICCHERQSSGRVSRRRSSAT